MTHPTGVFDNPGRIHEGQVIDLLEVLACLKKPEMISSISDFGAL